VGRVSNDNNADLEINEGVLLGASGEVYCYPRDCEISLLVRERNREKEVGFARAEDFGLM
jgi:hypothetical protein